MKTVEEILSDLADREGGEFTDDPKDSGGATKWGWTRAAYSKMGMKKPLELLTRSEAIGLYYQRFVINSGYQHLLPISVPIMEEMVDTAVNSGEVRAGTFLQRCLNALNNEQKLYLDVKVDGMVGNATRAALIKYLGSRKEDGELILMRALNCLQGAFYIELCEGRPKDERFVYGWLRNRVIL
jgi:lysozyme family protein